MISEGNCGHGDTGTVHEPRTVVVHVARVVENIWQLGRPITASPVERVSRRVLRCVKRDKP